MVRYRSDILLHLISAALSLKLNRLLQRSEYLNEENSSKVNQYLMRDPPTPPTTHILNLRIHYSRQKCNPYSTQAQHD